MKAEDPVLLLRLFTHENAEFWIARAGGMDPIMGPGIFEKKTGKRLGQLVCIIEGTLHGNQLDTKAGASGAEGTATQDHGAGAAVPDSGVRGAPERADDPVNDYFAEVEEKPKVGMGYQPKRFPPYFEAMREEMRRSEAERSSVFDELLGDRTVGKQEMDAEDREQFVKLLQRVKALEIELGRVKGLYAAEIEQLSEILYKLVEHRLGLAEYESVMSLYRWFIGQRRSRQNEAQSGEG
jgi:hypothetical protein